MSRFKPPRARPGATRLGDDYASSTCPYPLGNEPKEIPMRKVYRVIPFCSVAGLLFLSAGEAHAQPYPITDLYNTGVNDGPAPAGSGPPLSPGAADPHYTIVSGSTDGSGDPSPALGAAIVNDNGYPTHTTAAWIGPGNTGEDQSGTTYDYQTTFSLPEGAIAVNINCDVDVDNAMTEILVNGNIVPFSSPLYQQLTGTDGEGLTNHNIASEIPITIDPPYRRPFTEQHVDFRYCESAGHTNRISR